jgi:hypothetical protein
MREGEGRVCELIVNLSRMVRRRVEEEAFR